MSEKIKNNEYLKMVYQYLDKQMTESELNAFEKLLSDDPFLSDAVDGLRQIKQTDVIKDISIINIVDGKLHNNKTIYLVVSLVLLIVLIVFAVIVFVKNDKGKIIESKSSESIFPELIDENQGNELFVAEPDSTLFADSISNEELKNNEISIEQSKLKTVKTEINTEKKQVKPVTKKEANSHALEPLSSIPATVDQLQVPVKTEKSIISLSNDTINKTLAENNTKQLSVLIEGDENEANVSEMSSVAKREGANATPQPLGGFELYNQYIDNNIQYPEIDGNRKRVSLKVQFKVSTNGAPKNISVARGSENEAFVSEAIRLVQNGPKWSPAIKNGEPVEQDVSIRIVFKP